MAKQCEIRICQRGQPTETIIYFKKSVYFLSYLSIKSQPWFSIHFVSEAAVGQLMNNVFRLSE